MARVIASISLNIMDGFGASDENPIGVTITAVTDQGDSVTDFIRLTKAALANVTPTNALNSVKDKIIERYEQTYSQVIARSDVLLIGGIQ